MKLEKIAKLVLNKLKDPKEYVPFLSLCKKRSPGGYVFHTLYSIKSLYDIVWLSVGIYSGIWNPIDQYKEFIKFIKPDKEVYQENYNFRDKEKKSDFYLKSLED